MFKSKTLPQSFDHVWMLQNEDFCIMKQLHFITQYKPRYHLLEIQERAISSLKNPSRRGDLCHPWFVCKQPQELKVGKLACCIWYIVLFGCRRSSFACQYTVKFGWRKRPVSLPQTESLSRQIFSQRISGFGKLCSKKKKIVDEVETLQCLFLEVSNAWHTGFWYDEYKDRPWGEGKVNGQKVTGLSQSQLYLWRKCPVVNNSLRNLKCPMKRAACSGLCHNGSATSRSAPLLR